LSGHASSPRKRGPIRRGPTIWVVGTDTLRNSDRR
jgi:hypothetical protein